MEPMAYHTIYWWKNSPLLAALLLWCRALEFHKQVHIRATSHMPYLFQRSFWLCHRYYGIQIACLTVCGSYRISAGLQASGLEIEVSPVFPVMRQITGLDGGPKILICDHFSKLTHPTGKKIWYMVVFRLLPKKVYLLGSPNMCIWDLFWMYIR
jgi:hypothetical protein